MAVKGRKEKQLDKKAPEDVEPKANCSAEEYPVENGETPTKQDETSFLEESLEDSQHDKNTDDYSGTSSDDNEKSGNEDVNNDWSSCHEEDNEKVDSKNSNEKSSKGESSIFVGNAPIGIKVEKIKAHFSKYGKVKKCTVIKDKNQNNNSKYRRAYPPRNISAIIYIDFTTEESARNACEENQKMFEGKRLRVSLARERKPINKEATLFVGNLKYTTSEEELYDAFVEYGEIDMVRIIAGKGFGFVHFADPGSVDKAAAIRNKSKFNGREIHVERSRPPIQKNPGELETLDRVTVNQDHLKRQQAPGGYLNYRRNQTRNQLALELLERVISVQCKRPKSGIKF